MLETENETNIVYQFLMKPYNSHHAWEKQKTDVKPNMIMMLT